MQLLHEAGAAASGEVVAVADERVVREYSGSGEGDGHPVGRVARSSALIGVLVGDPRRPDGRAGECRTRTTESGETRDDAGGKRATHARRHDSPSESLILSLDRPSV